MAIMGDLALRLQKLFPGIKFLQDVVVQDDGEGPYIKYWSRPEPMPTPEQLKAVDVSQPVPKKPSIEEQLALLYMDQIHGTKSFSEAIDRYNASIQ